jgi:hypothetical protein
VATQMREEMLRRAGIAAALYQGIEHDAVLVNGAPQDGLPAAGQVPARPAFDQLAAASPRTR